MELLLADGERSHLPPHGETSFRSEIFHAILDFCGWMAGPAAVMSGGRLTQGVGQDRVRGGRFLGFPWVHRFHRFRRWVRGLHAKTRRLDGRRAGTKVAFPLCSGVHRPSLVRWGNGMVARCTGRGGAGSVAPAGAGFQGTRPPTACAVGYLLSALRAWSRGSEVRRRASPFSALLASRREAKHGSEPSPRKHAKTHRGETGIRRLRSLRLCDLSEAGVRNQPSTGSEGGWETKAVAMSNRLSVVRTWVPLRDRRMGGG